MPCTPAIVRTRQCRQNFQISSPSDAVMSPCTKKLTGNGHHGAMKGGSIPWSLLKEKQKMNVKNDLGDQPNE
ncbi:unnamed protein product [Anisakis simplex]|uniref:Ovule protein n=1 Tax=Anisakis simplex TaxID=6269 RepID=A0A0M3K3E4_ANISI|nr:unnamed protein product [Anisakis simplex]